MDFPQQQFVPPQAPSGFGMQTPVSTPAPVPAAPQPVVPENLQTMFTQAASQPQQPVNPLPGAVPGGFSAAPAPPPAAFVPPAPSQYAAQAAQLGIELPATASDAEVAAAVMARYQQIAPAAQFGESMMPYADQMNEFFRAQGTVPAPSTAQQPGTGPAEWIPQAHFQKLWNSPAITPEMKFAIEQGMVLRDDESGMMKARPGMEMMVAPILHGLNSALNYQRQQWQEIMQANPYEKFYGAMQEPIEKLIDKRVQEKLNGYQSQVQDISTINQFEQTNAQWLYQPNANGGKMLTTEGQYFTQLYQAKQGNWSGTNDELLRDCRDLTELAVIRSRAQQPPAAPPVAPLNGNGNGQYPPPMQPVQQTRQSFWQTALQHASHVPSGGANPVQSAGGPIVVTPGELDSMFVNDFRAGRSAA